MKVYLLFRTKYDEEDFGGICPAPSTFHGVYESKELLEEAKTKLPQLETFKTSNNRYSEDEKYVTVITNLNEVTDIWTDDNWVEKNIAIREEHKKKYG